MRGMWLWGTCWRASGAVRGERYILGSENLTLAQILGKLAAITGRPAPQLQVALRGGLCRGCGVDGLGEDQREAAAGASRCGAHGPQEDVRVARQSRAASWVMNPGRPDERAGAGGRMVSGQRILLVAAEPREFAGLVAVLFGCAEVGLAGALGPVWRVARKAIVDGGQWRRARCMPAGLWR